MDAAAGWTQPRKEKESPSQVARARRRRRPTRPRSAPSEKPRTWSASWYLVASASPRAGTTHLLNSDSPLRPECDRAPRAEQHRWRSMATRQEKHRVEGLVRELREKDEKEARKRRIISRTRPQLLVDIPLGIGADPTEASRESSTAIRSLLRGRTGTSAGRTRGWEWTAPCRSSDESRMRLPRRRESTGRLLAAAQRVGNDQQRQYEHRRCSLSDRLAAENV